MDNRGTTIAIVQTVKRRKIFCQLRLSAVKFHSVAPNVLMEYGIDHTLVVQTANFRRRESISVRLTIRTTFFHYSPLRTLRGVRRRNEASDSLLLLTRAILGRYTDQTC